MRIIYLLALLIIIGCHSKPNPTENPIDLFSSGMSVGVIDRRLEEASGLIGSVNNPGMLWTINDSGHPAEVFLIDSTAKIRMVCKLENAHNRDWEDITLGPGPEEGKTYIYVGDIGDNDSKFPIKIIYRVEEPVISKGEIVIQDVDILYIKLSDGIRDSEAMFVDPFSRDLFLLSKREDSVRLYQAYYPFKEDTVIAYRRLTLPLQKIVAAAVSSNGDELIMKNYGRVYYWRRSSDQSILEMLKSTPNELAYEPEMQGEAICFSRDGKGYYTLSESSESKQAELMYYKKK